MATRVVMPKLTDTMEEGTVLSWKKQEGDQVAAGDVLAEIETDKAVMDLEAFGSGTLRKIVSEAGQTVKSGALIAVIAEPDEDIDGALSERREPGTASGPEVKPRPSGEAKAKPQPATQMDRRPDERAREKQPEQAPTKQPPAREPELKVSPRARALARERGVDLTRITGSGPDGRIVERDILEAERAPSASQTEVSGQERPLSQMRKAIARTMTQSKAPVPHFYLTTEIDMADAERVRAQIKQARRTHPSVTDLLIKATALALAKHPEVNVSYAEDSLKLHGTIDIGVAVGIEEGLITPVVRDCGHKTLWEISRVAHDLIERARSRKLAPPDYTGATFSISNLGMFDVENFVAVLVPPQAASLAVGSIRDVPVVLDGHLVPRRRMKVTLSCDHRVLDGMQAARFLEDFKRILEHPLDLILPEEDR